MDGVLYDNTSYPECKKANKMCIYSKLVYIILTFPSSPDVLHLWEELAINKPWFLQTLVIFSDLKCILKELWKLCVKYYCIAMQNVLANYRITAFSCN